MANPKTPLHTVLFGMFPNALRALAEHAQFGNEKHNPGEPLHWAFDKSTQHADCVLSHLAKAGQTDPETGRSHSFAMLWRACALLETELVNAGAEPGFAVRFEGETDQPWGIFVRAHSGELCESALDKRFATRTEAEAFLAEKGSIDGMRFVAKVGSK